MPETSTSFGAASAAIRAPVCTAIPLTSPAASSHSPVCTPARTSSPRSLTDAAITVVRFEKISPSSVAECHGSLRRSHDVGEQHGRQDALHTRRKPHPRDEGLDLGEGIVDRRPREERVDVAWELDEAGTGGAGGQSRRTG